MITPPKCSCYSNETKKKWSHSFVDTSCCTGHGSISCWLGGGASWLRHKSASYDRKNISQIQNVTETISYGPSDRGDGAMLQSMSSSCSPCMLCHANNEWCAIKERSLFCFLFFLVSLQVIGLSPLSARQSRNTKATTMQQKANKQTEKKTNKTTKQPNQNQTNLTHTKPKPKTKKKKQKNPNTHQHQPKPTTPAPNQPTPNAHTKPPRSHTRTRTPQRNDQHEQPTNPP